MNSPVDFPDRIHLEKLRQMLWCGREFGRAAVMVGAGFSRNAERRSQSIPPFPLWKELAKLLRDSLHPGDPQDTIPNKGALRLASEYEATFGRQALDELLLRLIPDNDYSPGRLHELLLSLPWSDVFTTNYDTLLERTLPKIHDRKYDVVVTVSDISGRMKPRIVKLHGSFPSHRPFIIAEEDYRTYPTSFAPFVNTVQQAIMENAVCLIGFSGDDPNFLYWSGWVRDNLGSSAPSIYLCGLLSLSTSERRVLESRKVIPIDLSPLFPTSRWSDSGIRHAKGLEWLLLTLMYGEPPSLSNWPRPSMSRAASWKASEGLPALIPGPKPISSPDKAEPKDRLLTPEEMLDLCKSWQQKREEYPGWVVCPKSNRDELWSYTVNWVERVLGSVEKLPPPENILLLYELNWRLETTLTPLFMHWVEKMTPLVESFNPYPWLVNLAGASVRPDQKEYERLDWKHIGECWVSLAFALAREAREDHDESRFRLWMDRLNNVSRQHNEWVARWNYEECLFRLFRFDLEAVLSTLEAWPESPDLPFWEIRRASLLAELGELKEAERVAEAALDKIRSRLQPYSIDYSLLSQEGWAMVLLKAINDGKWSTERELLGQQYRDRWDRLDAYRCNPWTEIEELVAIVNGPSPEPKPPIERKKGFDPGATTITRQFFSQPSTVGILPAFALLRMFEEGALPMVCGMFTMFSRAALNSATWIAPSAPFWSLSSIVRVGSADKIDEKLDDRFDRVPIAGLAQTEVDRLYQLFTNGLVQAIKHLTRNLQGDGLGRTVSSDRQVRLLSELLSRLSIRLSNDQFAQLFALASDMYGLPLFRERHTLHQPLGSLFKRLLYVMPDSEILQRIPQLLSLPIPSEGGFQVSTPDWWPEPLAFVRWSESTHLPSDVDRTAWSGPIANLIRIVRDGTPQARERAVTRLVGLHEVGGLTAEEGKVFAGALWSKLDPGRGLPVDTGFRDVVFLRLPEPVEGLAGENLRKFLLAQDFPRVVQKSSGAQQRFVGIGGQRNWYIQAWVDTVPMFPRSIEEKQRYLDWTSDEATQLLKKALAWWNEEKGELSDAFFADDVREQLEQLPDLMSIVVLPRLAGVSEEVKVSARQLLSEMEQADFCILSALPMTLFIAPDSVDEIAHKIRRGFYSNKRREVQGTIEGLGRWLVQSSLGSITAPPVDLLDELVNKAAHRVQPALDVAIHQLSRVVGRVPGVLHEDHLKSLCVALEYLITETDLPRKVDQEALDSLYLTIPVKERPEYRSLAGKLAYQMFLLFVGRNEAVPQVLLQWKEICENDPLPEVRRVWRDIR